MAAASQPLRVLVIEDDPLVARSLVRFFQRYGEEAEASLSLAEAMDAVARGSWDAFVVDVVLGSESGMELLRWMRDRGIKSPALILTGVGDEDTMRDAAREQALFLPKPASDHDLLAFLRWAHTCLGAHLLSPEEAARRVASDHGLDEAEAALLELRARGYQQQEAADRLGLATRTARRLVSSILDKTGASSVRDLIRRVALHHESDQDPG